MTSEVSARSGRWHPVCTQTKYDRRPAAGDIVPMDHAVWRITEVVDIPLSDTDRRKYDEQAAWTKGRLAPAEEWDLRPFRVAAEWVGGVKPEWVTPGQKVGSITVRSNQHRFWQVYPGGRWPQCSCCGEPMPCRAAITDVQVGAEMDRFTEMASRLPGTCWGCGNPVTSRQRSVTYPGDNLDLPGGPTVRFHAAKDCRWKAEKYEARWLKANPGRARRLTWPDCRGHLFWHADGSSECVGGRPDCEGHHTHNHGSQAGCRYMDDGCPRGCDPHQSYCNPKRWKRPWLRPDDLPQDGDNMRRGWLLASDDEDASDSRKRCPGTLIEHRDGSTVCTAGGLDDCWDGSKYAHRRRRSCDELSHGCPTCETTENLT